MNTRPLAMSAASAAAQARPRVPLAVESGLSVAIAMAVLFSAPLHEQLGFTSGLFALSVALLGVSRVLAVKFLAQGRPHASVSVHSLVDTFAAVITLTLAHTPAQLALVMVCWAATTFLVRLWQRFSMSHAMGSRLVALAPLLMTVLLMTAGSDLVALIGWFGAYTVVFGVFGLIAACDVPSGKHTAAKSGTEIDD